MVAIPEPPPNVISARRESVPDLITLKVEKRRPWKFVTTTWEVETDWDIG
jgi:hypothetical protein